MNNKKITIITIVIAVLLVVGVVLVYKYASKEDNKQPEIENKQGVETEKMTLEEAENLHNEIKHLMDFLDYIEEGKISDLNDWQKILIGTTFCGEYIVENTDWTIENPYQATLNEKDLDKCLSKKLNTSVIHKQYDEWKEYELVGKYILKYNKGSLTIEYNNGMYKLNDYGGGHGVSGLLRYEMVDSLEKTDSTYKLSTYRYYYQTEELGPKTHSKIYKNKNEVVYDMKNTKYEEFIKQDDIEYYEYNFDNNLIKELIEDNKLDKITYTFELVDNVYVWKEYQIN